LGLRVRMNNGLGNQISLSQPPEGMRSIGDREGNGRYEKEEGYLVMAIREIKEDELINLPRMGNGREAVLFFTPFCGTCNLAERMLEIVEATGVSVNLFKLNINYAPKLRDAWKISSVPFLVLLEEGQPSRFEYAVQSVGYLYDLLK
jgi:thiol-disulfide isomerase/thioredoxin